MPACLQQLQIIVDDGHAMMKSDNFALAPRLEHCSAWMTRNCQQMRADIKTHVYVSQETSREVVS